MKQVQIPRYGAPDVLRVVEGPDPAPGPGQVRIAVRAAGVNFADVLARMGLYQDAPKPPMVVGYEVSGVLDAVGVAALQIARAHGAEVLGTASAGKHERLRQMGFAHLIDYRTTDFEAEVRRLTDGRGVHLVLDAVGGASFGKSYRSLAKNGRLFCFGISALAPDQKRRWLAALKGFASMPWFHPGRLMLDNRGVFGVNLGQLWDEPAVMTDQLHQLLALYEGGTVAPIVDAAVPFAQAADAHRRLQERQNLGKVVLVP